MQPGVWDGTDFKVVQRAAGANMSVDIGSGYALVPADDPGNAGIYHVQNDATVNLATFAAANATNPRIDQVILRVNDTTHGGDVSDTPTVEVVSGTATSGATLDNRTGAAAMPTGSLRLADVLIPATSTSVVTANIRDRRPWARGGILRMQGSSAYSITTTTPTIIDSTNVSSRLEIGAYGTLDTEIAARIIVPANGGSLGMMIDGAVQLNAGLQASSDNWRNLRQNLSGVAAGSHVFAAQWAVAVAAQTQSIPAGNGPIVLVQEFVRPFTNNN